MARKLSKIVEWCLDAFWDVAAEGGPASLELNVVERPKGESDSRVVFANGTIRISVEEELASQRIMGQEEDVTGHRVWPTASIFCKYLCDHKEVVSS